MTFYEVLEQVQALLQRHGRVSYRALKRQFQLDDAYLEDLKAELVEVQRAAVDQDGTILVWTGDAPAASLSTAPAPAQEPRVYTPAHLTEKILATRAALEGERKQVTVLFADLKGSTELIAERGRLQAAVARGLTRFVGRQTELEALSQALARAGAGQGQVVAAFGEAGVGKSRLVYEFLRSHHTQGWLVLESTSVSYGKATPYFPVIDLLKRYAHVEEHDDPRTVRAKVTGQVLTLDETLQDTVPALPCSTLCPRIAHAMDMTFWLPREEAALAEVQ
jgi:hypothetical protein